jgi:hypothetical protein
VLAPQEVYRLTRRGLFTTIIVAANIVAASAYAQRGGGGQDYSDTPEVLFEAARQYGL